MTTQTKIWTWTEIYAKILQDADMQEEDFMDEAELKSHTNDAISAAEAIIHTEYPDYFLTFEQGNTLEDAIDTYDLPENIYGTKIKTIIISNGSTIVYECKRMASLKKFLEYRLARTFQTTATDRRMYFLANQSESGPRIILTAPPTGTGWVYDIWYYRMANRIVDTDDVCDLPQFMSYIFQWVRERIEWKRRRGSAAHQLEVQKVSDEEGNLLSKAQGMVNDGDTPITPNIGIYEDMN